MMQPSLWFCLLVLGSSPSDNLRKIQSASMSVALWSNYLQACPKGDLRPKIFELAKHLFVPSRVESNPRRRFIRFLAEPGIPKCLLLFREQNISDWADSSTSKIWRVMKICLHWQSNYDICNPCCLFFKWPIKKHITSLPILDPCYLWEGVKVPVMESVR